MSEKARLIQLYPVVKRRLHSEKLGFECLEQCENFLGQLMIKPSTGLL